MKLQTHCLIPKSNSKTQQLGNMKKSDKVVHNEKIGYYGYTLEYGTTLSSPPIQIENVSGWKNEKLIQLKRNFDTELKLVQDKYNEIV